MAQKTTKILHGKLGPAWETRRGKTGYWAQFSFHTVLDTYVACVVGSDLIAQVNDLCRSGLYRFSLVGYDTPRGFRVTAASPELLQS